MRPNVFQDMGGKARRHLCVILQRLVQPVDTVARFHAFQAERCVRLYLCDEMLAQIEAKYGHHRPFTNALIAASLSEVCQNAGKRHQRERREHYPHP